MGKPLFTISNLTFTLFDIFSLILGIVAGATFLLLFYLLAIAIKLRPKKIKLRSINNNLSEQMLNEIVEEKSRAFSNKKLQKKIGQWELFCKLTKELFEEIATNFQPNSKTPLYEITIDEALELGIIVSNDLENVFDTPLLKPFRFITIAFIANIVDFLKLNRTQNFIKIWQKANVVFKIVNFYKPTMWLGLLRSKLYNYVLNRYYILAMSIIAEEAYYVYSKTIFNDNNDLLKDTKAIKTLTKTTITSTKNEKSSQIKTKG